MTTATTPVWNNLLSWQDLPNVAHIERILADLQANPGNWSKSWRAVKSKTGMLVRTTAMYNAWDKTVEQNRNQSWHEVWDSMADAAKSMDARDAAEQAVWALVTWDDAGDYLDMTQAQLEMLVKSDDPKAILLLPAVMAFEKSKELA